MTFNIGGMGNLAVLLKIVNEYEIDFIAIQEVMLRAFTVTERLTRFFPTYRWIVKTPDSELQVEDAINQTNFSFHGVALGVQEKLWETVREVSVDHPNVIMIKVKLGGQEFLLANLYLPTGGHDDEYGEALDVVGQVLQRETGDFSVLMMGDINVERNSSARRRRLWGDFLNDFSLTDHVMSHVTHVHHHWKTENELDRFITRDTVVREIQVINDDVNLSDHRPVLATVLVSGELEGEDKKGERIETKVNLQKLLENQEEFKRRTDELATEMEQFQFLERDVYNAALSSAIFQTAIHCTGQKVYQSQSPRPQRKFKLDRQFYDEVRKTKAAWRNTGYSPLSSAKNDYKDARKRMTREIWRLSREEDRDINLRIAEAAASKSSKLFSLLKDLRQTNTKKMNMPSKIEGYGLQFKKPNVLEGFKELYSVQTMLDFQPRYDELSYNRAKARVRLRRELSWSEAEFQRLTMSRPEFDKIINRLKFGKAQDCFGMSNDLLKLCGDKMLDLIYHFCKSCLESGDVGGVLRNFGKGSVIMKKWGKPPSQIGTWRKIVSNDVINVVIQMQVQGDIERRISGCQTQFQLGFTKGIPVNNAVVLRMELVQLAKFMRRPLFMIVLDLKSCFPSISREHMLELAADVLTPAQWQLLDQIYTDTWGEIRMAAQKSTPFYANRGTVEGGLLSPAILKLFLSVLLTILGTSGFDSEINLETRTVNPGCVVIADDIYGWVWGPEDARLFLSLCQWWTDHCRSEFSTGKTNLVIVNAEEGKDYGKFHMNGEELEVVKISEHLGIPVTEERPAEEALKVRETKTRRAMFSTISYWNPKSIVTTAIKIELWRDVYRSMFIYSLDTVDLLAKQIRRIETFQNKVLRSIFKTSTRAKLSLLKLLAGVPTLWMVIWLRRLGLLNGIIMGNTIVSPMIALMLDCEVERSWTVKTVRMLAGRLQGSHVNVYDFLCKEGNNFKTDVKIILEAEEIRRMRSEIDTVGLWRVPAKPFKNPLPLVFSGFSDIDQRLVRSYSAVYCMDFFRSFDGECLACDAGNGLRDDTEHLLSFQCVVSRDSEVILAWVEIKTTLSYHFPDHSLSSEIFSRQLRTRWLLNPACDSLQENAISPENLQLSGLDTKIKRLHHSLLSSRYKILSNKGYQIKRKF